LLPPGEHLADGDDVTFDIDADRDGRKRAANVRVTARASPERTARQAGSLAAATERDRRRPARERREARRERVWTHEGAGEL
jgi:hypothetical protein